METGTVKWFNVTKGYGFITPDSGSGHDIFIHISVVEASGLSSLEENQRVEFETGKNRDKIAVTKVKLA